MRADYRVILDACVLNPMPLADMLLRMAEAPRLYLPRWSQVTRNLIVIVTYIHNRLGPCRWAIEVYRNAV